MALPEENRLTLEIGMPPEWGHIDAVRQGVGLCADAAFSDAALRESLPMVCAELLENAVKYGAVAPVRLAIRTDDGGVTVTVENSVGPGSDHAGNLQRRLAWLREFPDAAEAYAAVLAKVYEHADSEGEESGLGIVRVAYEGRCSIECDTSTPGVITVRARRPMKAALRET